MDRDYELQTHRAEDRHWWYRGRRRIVAEIVAGVSAGRILDAGCGSGRNMVELARLGQVTGVEVSSASVQVARGRGVGEVLEGSILQMPFAADSFDLGLCLDVIEHMADDRAALRELRRVIAPRGVLVVTVPAYQSLWSRHDELNEHYRRYNRRTLLETARAAGWEPVRTTYFNATLLPVAVMLRVLARLNRRATESSLDLWVPPGPINWLLEQPLRLESKLIAEGRRIPFGLSLLAVLR